jgi:hypothetical protein
MNCWFTYFQSKHNGNKPTFIGAAAGCYKKLVSIIKQKTIEAGYEWNERTAHDSMLAFFESAYNHNDRYFQTRIRDNFTTPNLLYNIDKILIFNGKQSPTSTFQKFARVVQTAQERVLDVNYQPGGERIP